MSEAKKIELMCFGGFGSELVLLPEGRKYPGVLIQGDKLLNIRALLNALKSSLNDGGADESPEDLCDELLDIVSGYIDVYKEAIQGQDLEK
jgi:hypothetical protein